jgi:hypothetical protein
VIEGISAGFCPNAPGAPSGQSEQVTEFMKFSFSIAKIRIRLNA